VILLSGSGLFPTRRPSPARMNLMVQSLTGSRCQGSPAFQQDQGNLQHNSVILKECVSEYKYRVFFHKHSLITGEPLHVLYLLVQYIETCLLARIVGMAPVS
jgi:hypothetical protein